MTKIIKITLEDNEGVKYEIEGKYQAQLVQQFFGMGSRPAERMGPPERFHNGNNVTVIVLGSTLVCEHIKECLEPIERLINS